MLLLCADMVGVTSVLVVPVLTSILLISTELPIHSLMSWHMMMITMMSMVRPRRLRHQRKTGKHFGSGTGSPYLEARCREGRAIRLFFLCLLLV